MGKYVTLISESLTKALSFGPLLSVRKRVWPTFIWACLIFVRTKKGFGPLFLGFGPLLFSKPGQLKPSNCNGSSRFGPLSHFFLLLIVIKKIINIYNRANKTGLLAQDILRRIFQCYVPWMIERF